MKLVNLINSISNVPVYIRDRFVQRLTPQQIKTAAVALLVLIGAGVVIAVTVYYWRERQLKQIKDKAPVSLPKDKDNIDNLDAQTPAGRTLLSIAASSGNLDEVNNLLGRGANASIADSAGLLPIHWAVQGGNLKVLEVLLSKTLDINIKDKTHRTPLVIAAELCNLDAVNYFLSLGADASIANDFGLLPIHWAAQYGNLKMTEALRSKTKDINLKDHLHQRTPLSFAAGAGARTDSLAVVNYLLKEGADASIADDFGLLPIHWAAQKGNLNIVKALINPEHINAKANNSKTLLGFARESKDTELVNYLLAQGAVD